MEQTVLLSSKGATAKGATCFSYRGANIGSNERVSKGASSSINGSSISSNEGASKGASKEATYFSWEQTVAPIMGVSKGAKSSISNGASVSSKEGASGSFIEGASKGASELAVAPIWEPPREQPVPAPREPLQQF
jgi:hypothetical protein